MPSHHAPARPRATRVVLDVTGGVGLLDRPEGYDCFVVEIDRALARALLRLIRTVQRLARTHPQLYKLELWDGHGDYFAAEEEEATEPCPACGAALGPRLGPWHRAEEPCDTVQTPPVPLTRVAAAADFRYIPVGEASRTECARLMVLPDGVHWAAYPKHSDLEVETETLPLSELLKIARPPKQGP